MTIPFKLGLRESARLKTAECQAVPPTALLEWRALKNAIATKFYHTETSAVIGGKFCHCNHPNPADLLPPRALMRCKAARIKGLALLLLKSGNPSCASVLPSAPLRFKVIGQFSTILNQNSYKEF
ncbi:hypothetical protein [Tolypothrix sp. NIES-4075]|uniref:hypothetical protein n=1 Tax=Tolypothrix sp. NIES-4075 TaxID=2005459 RepID=UPI00190E990D